MALNVRHVIENVWNTVPIALGLEIFGFIVDERRCRTQISNMHLLNGLTDEPRSREAFVTSQNPSLSHPHDGIDLP